ncbi:unnamed protein product [Heterobilharzia americana]|nr:unnamed protein product [Heterobilharzia americana]
MEVYNDIQKKIDLLRADCSKSDKQIQACQLQLKKTEVILSTALYYSRQKLDSMTTAVKNPIDLEELVRFSHRISATHGVIAPDNWTQGDPRRPYPNKEEIRRGYLGHIDDSGNFRQSLWEAFSDTAAAAASITVSSTPSVSSSSGPNSFPNQNVGASQNPTYHSSQPQPTSFSLVTCSPNMVLPESTWFPHQYLSHSLLLPLHGPHQIPVSLQGTQPLRSSLVLKHQSLVRPQLH